MKAGKTYYRNTRTFRLFIGLFAGICCAVSLPAKDFGLILDQSVSYMGTEEKSMSSLGQDLEYTGLFVPWFSTHLGERGSLYLSAGLRGEYGNREWIFVPELFRTEVDWSFTKADLRVGRIYYSDPLGYTAQGLFDGLGVSLPAGNGTFSFSLMYTGFTYKKSANITMTEEDLAKFYEKFEYSSFIDTYFASRRVIAAFGWETIAAELVRINLALVGQIDVNNGDGAFHSQYLEGKIRVPVKVFVINAGVCLELSEARSEYNVALAGDLGVDWMLPTAIQDRLSLLGRFSSGRLGSSIAPFTPITTVSQGNILKAKLSGLSMIQLAYAARLHQTFSLVLESSYFVLSDLGTYNGWPSGKDGYFLGNEFYGRLIWSPVSDIQLQAGGGAFLPSLGNAAPNAQLRWNVELKAIVALF